MRLLILLIISKLWECKNYTPCLFFNVLNFSNFQIGRVSIKSPFF